MSNRRKRERRKIVSVKSMVLLVTLVLGIGITAGSSLAWLTAVDTPIKNSFMTSDINVDLTEKTTYFQMIPGHTITKDPYATVLYGSQECYLFVRLEKGQDFDSYLEFQIADGWTVLDGETDVIYRKVTEADIGKPHQIIKGDMVYVKTTVTKEMMVTAEDNHPTLTLTAYASQLMKEAGKEFSVEEAWANLQPSN